MNCLECGAPDLACETHYHECLAKEFENPAFGAVHHLTVASYMLQHSSKLTREGWLYERELLEKFVDQNTAPETIRRENKDLVDSGKRNFKITSTTGHRITQFSSWSKTVVDIRLENPEAYCQDVEAWALSTLRDSKNLSV